MNWQLCVKQCHCDQYTGSDESVAACYMVWECKMATITGLSSDGYEFEL